MERQYIWFHSGSACLVSCLGLVLATVVSLFLLIWLGANFVTFGLLLVIYGALLLPAFVLDDRLKESQKGKNATNLVHQEEHHDLNGLDP
ncbi:MAG: hypothetical protein KDA93_12825 [Planctomycetaceae bacterium]|nr:hypothetical protein [Planctomycetaceae bacterium]